jgi:hypothetical protein
VRSLFLLLLILGSVSVGWFFAGGKFVVEFPQSTVSEFIIACTNSIKPFLVATEEDAPVEFDFESDERKYSQIEQEIQKEDDLIAIDYDETPAQCVRQKGMAFIN